MGVRPRDFISTVPSPPGREAGGGEEIPPSRVSPGPQPVVLAGAGRSRTFFEVLQVNRLVRVAHGGRGPSRVPGAPIDPALGLALFLHGGGAPSLAYLVAGAPFQVRSLDVLRPLVFARVLFRLDRPDGLPRGPSVFLPVPLGPADGAVGGELLAPLRRPLLPPGSLYPLLGAFEFLAFIVMDGKPQSPIGPVPGPGVGLVGRVGGLDIYGVVYGACLVDRHRSGSGFPEEVEGDGVVWGGVAPGHGALSGLGLCRRLRPSFNRRFLPEPLV